MFADGRSLSVEAPLRVITAIVAGYFLGLPLFDKFMFISNQRPDGRFEKSLWDITFLMFYICVFTALRAVIMNHMLIPLAKAAGVSKKKYERFAEQGYSFLYYSISFSCGAVSSGRVLREEDVCLRQELTQHSISCIIHLGIMIPVTFGVIIQ